MLVNDIMRKQFHTFKTGDTLAQAGEMINSYKLYGAPVVDDNYILQGSFTRSHLINALIHSYELITPIEKIMQKFVVTLNPESDLNEAIKLFVETGYRNYPVVDNNRKLKGVLLSSDLLEVGSQEFYKFFGTHDFDYLGNALIGIDNKGYVKSLSKTAVNILGENIKLILNKHIIETIPFISQISKEILSDAKKAKELSRQLNITKNQLDYYREELESMTGKYTFNDIIGETHAIRNLRVTASQAARTSSTIIISGESGTGKELVAHAIHNASPRSNGPFIKVNCAAIPDTLMESVLFGYVEGAFTGASKKGKPGKFELANSGTIFLDEIGDMHPLTQAKLLRVLQEHEVERLGSNETIHINVRVIAATNKSLKQLVKQGFFREDLFYRLNVIQINTPPLRERKEDISLLCKYLIDKICSKLHLNVCTISEDALEFLKSYDFPGNVRELENLLERAINFADDNGILNINHFSQLNLYQDTSNKNSFDVIDNKPQTLTDAVAEAERKAILSALSLANGNRNEAARILNIHRSLLYKKLSKYNIS